MNLVGGTAYIIHQTSTDLATPTAKGQGYLPYQAFCRAWLTAWKSLGYFLCWYKIGRVVSHQQRIDPDPRTVKQN